LLLGADTALDFAVRRPASRFCCEKRQQLPSIETPLEQKRVDPFEISPSPRTPA
jgi:hypothetical protein